MKMSVTPVRESLIRLSASSALALTPSHAFFVPIITSEQFNEYMRMSHKIGMFLIVRIWLCLYF